MNGKGWLLVGLFATACTASPSVSIEPRPPGRKVSEGPPLTSFGLEDAFDRGRYLAIQRYLEQLPRRDLESSPTLSFLHGRVLAARGDFEGATRALEIALYLAGARQQPEVEWAIAQARAQANDFSQAARYGEDAASHGRILAAGYLQFLRALAETPLYAGWPAGSRAETSFRFDSFDLIRLPVRANGSEVTAVLDSGASYSIVTRSCARLTGVREVPQSDAWGRGLHGKQIPLTFGVMERLELGGLTIANVPVMIMPDDALLFETRRGPLPIPMLLGLHLLKEFRLLLDYGTRRITFTRLAPGRAKTDPEQNLFFARGKLLVRVSDEATGWHSFLLDTGSEPTMLTSAGARRMRLPPSNKLVPRPVFGIGKARVEWGKVRMLAIGVDGYLARFQDVVVAEVEDSVEDGILGNSCLKHFHVTIDFEAMRLSLAARA